MVLLMLTNSYSSVWICFCQHFSHTSYCQVWGLARVPQEECFQTGFQECFIPFMVIFTGCLGAGLHQADLRLPVEQHHLHHGPTLRCWKVELLNVRIRLWCFFVAQVHAKPFRQVHFALCLVHVLPHLVGPCLPEVGCCPHHHHVDLCHQHHLDHPHHSQHHVFVINIIINTIFTSIIVFILGIIIITGLSTSWSQSSFSSSQMLRWQTHFVKEYWGDKPILLKHIEVTNPYCSKHWGDKPPIVLNIDVTNPFC